MKNKILLASLLVFFTTAIHADSAGTPSNLMTENALENGCEPTWTEQKCSNSSYGYAMLGVGFSSVTAGYKNLNTINTQAQFLNTTGDNAAEENPNFGPGMEFIITGQDSENENGENKSNNNEKTANSVLGSFGFGYNAALGNSPAMLGFFAGMNLMNNAIDLPITLSSYQLNAEDPDESVQISKSYETTLKANLSFNAGVTFGMKIKDTAFAFVKLGWTCVRVTSTNQNPETNTSTNINNNNNNKNNGYLPKYFNGFTYGGGIDFFVTERVSVGIEAFGNIYGNEKVTIFNINTPAVLNTDADISIAESKQSLQVNPLSLNSWGIMATVKLNFLER